jgi:small subunit ribosomal protein S21
MMSVNRSCMIDSGVDSFPIEKTRRDTQLPTVRVKKDESIERAVRRFKKLCNKEGLMREVKRRRFYIKPSEKRRRQPNKGRR